MTIVTHGFKIQRFLDLHIPACRWPRDAVRFKGIDPPESVVSRTVLEEAEAKRYVFCKGQGWVQSYQVEGFHAHLGRDPSRIVI